MFGYGPNGSNSSADTTINTANVTSLTLKFKWSPLGYAFGETVWSPVVANKTAYAEFCGGVAAFNATTGAPIWTQLDSGTANFCSDRAGHMPAVANGVVYDSSTDGNAQAFNAATGQPLWTMATGGGTSPIVHNGTVYVTGGNDVYALDGTNGAVKWTATVPRAGESAPAYAHGVVYLGPIDGTVYAFNASTGATVWTATIGAGAAVSSPAVVNGMVYVLGFGELDALNPTTGVPVWSMGLDGPVLPVTGIAVTPERVYAGGAGCNPLTAWNTQNGAYEWSAGSCSFTTPAVANGIAYIDTLDPGGFRLHAFNAVTGSDLWAATTEQLWTGPFGNPNVLDDSAPVIANGFVYIGSIEGSISAFGLP
jgi:outer membrane protein assembly factor BamB